MKTEDQVVLMASVGITLRQLVSGLEVQRGREFSAEDYDGSTSRLEAAGLIIVEEDGASAVTRQGTLAIAQVILDVAAQLGGEIPEGVAAHSAGARA